MFRCSQETLDERNIFDEESWDVLDMKHYRIHISTSKVETIELAKSTYCFRLMSYGLN